MDISTLSLPKEAMDCIQPWTCNLCGVESRFFEWCEPCDKIKMDLEFEIKCRKLALAQIEPYFAKKYGIEFSSNDFIISSDSERTARRNISSYVTTILKLEKDEWIYIKGILLYGNQGTGKNMMSNLIQYNFIKRGLRTHRDTQFGIYEKILNKEKTVRDYLEYDVLFIDEIGRINDTENATRTFFEIMDKFKSNNRQVVLTTNLNDKIFDYLDQERIKEYKKVLFDGESKRVNI